MHTSAPWIAPLVSLALLVSAPPQKDLDERLIAAWSKLEEPQRLDVVMNFSAQVESLDLFVTQLIAHAHGLEDADPGFLPEDAPPPHFDPEVHAAKDPIARKWLKADSKRAVEAREDFLGRHPGRHYASAWRYDWASGEVRRTAELEDPERTLRNALAGVPPGLDLAEALVLRALDDGSQRDALAAFGHAYTDRKGNVFPGVTLYDAWCSGRKMEMPDVDNLGIVHSLLDDWKTWESPVPKGDQ